VWTLQDNNLPLSATTLYSPDPDPPTHPDPQPEPEPEPDPDPDPPTTPSSQNTLLLLFATPLLPMQSGGKALLVSGHLTAFTMIVSLQPSDFKQLKDLYKV